VNSIGDTSRFALRRMPRSALLTARRTDRVEALSRDGKDKISRITAWSENRAASAQIEIAHFDKFAQIARMYGKITYD
jgi:hypothetical protein